MDVTVFSREDCNNCEIVKVTLKELGIPFKEYDAADALNPSAQDYFSKYADWRNIGVVEALALLQVDNTLPVVIIDGKSYTFKETLAKFKSIESKAVHDFVSAPVCADGVCTLTV